MSTPYNGGGYEPYPEHPEGSHPENGTGGTGDRAGDYPAYSSPNTESTYDAFEVNSAASMPSTDPVSVNADFVTLNPSPSLSSVTAASVWSVPALCPAFASAKLSAIVKQLACAAAMSSSGFVPGSSPNRVLKPYGLSFSTPDCVETWPLPSLPSPS